MGKGCIGDTQHFIIRKYTSEYGLFEEGQEGGRCSVCYIYISLSAWLLEAGKMKNKEDVRS